MTASRQPHSTAWVNFSYAAFVAAAAMVSAGILFLPLDWWVRGYFAMGIVMLVQSTVTLSKTLRDNDDATQRPAGSQGGEAR